MEVDAIALLQNTMIKYIYMPIQGIIYKCFTGIDIYTLSSLLGLVYQGNAHIGSRNGMYHCGPFLWIVPSPGVGWYQ